VAGQVRSATLEDQAMDGAHEPEGEGSARVLRVGLLPVEHRPRWAARLDVFGSPPQQFRIEG
jgi:hypothetical protein